VSNVWDTRFRLILEQLSELSMQLRSKGTVAPAALLEEQTVRLLTGVVMLLRQHHVNKHGQCEYCRWAWRFWSRQPQCTVYRCIDFALRQPLDIVWGRLLEDI
jgi:hypothetical protein